MAKKPAIIRRLQQELRMSIEEIEYEHLQRHSFRGERFGLFAQDAQGQIIALRLVKVSPPASVLWELTHLQYLGILNAGIQDLSPLVSLTALTLLDLNTNQIQDLSPLASLTALNQLYLFNNQIQDLSPLASLTALALLNLENNQIQDISPLAPLTALALLNLENNQIQDISPLASLTALALLGLTNNKIQDLSPISSLGALTQLVFSHNKFQNIEQPEVFPRTDGPFDAEKKGWEFMGITIGDNPLQRPPQEIARQGHDAIIAWFDAQRENQRPLREVKLLLVGAGGAGKTSLLKALQGKPHDPNESQTHGIRIEHWPVGCTQGTVQARLWDFGGQEIMHATHQFFMSERSLYLLVLDGRKEEGHEHYWLKLIESFGGNSPILVVINKIDENPAFELNRRALLETYPKIVGFHRLSCRHRDGLAAFRQAVVVALDAMELSATLWPEPWFQVKQHLETCGLSHIDYNTYRSLCEKHQLTARNQQDVLLGYLHDLGVTLHFKDLEWLNTQVLDPIWITDPIYALINHSELADHHGVVARQDLPRLLPDFPAERLSFLCDLMEKFQICHPLGSNKLLLPDLLPVEQPEFDFENHQGLHLNISYYFLPKSVLQRLMVQRYREIEPGLQWRTGVVLTHASLQSRALVRVDYGNRRLHLQLKGSQQRQYLNLLLDNLRRIHDDFEKIEPEECLRCPCSHCSHSDKPAEFRFTQVERFERGGTPLYCPESQEMVLSERLLNDTYVRPRTEAELEKELRELRNTCTDKAAFAQLAEIIFQQLPAELRQKWDLAALGDRVWSSAAPDQHSQTKAQKPPAFLCLATEWASGKGGISTFNRELCIALAEAGCHVVCLLPKLDPADQDDAAKHGVSLVSPEHQPGFDERHQLLGPIDLPAEHGPYWVVGHDHITGPQAAARVRQGGYAGFVFVVHTIQDEIEWFKQNSGRDPAQAAEARNDLQEELARMADLIVGVGPRITRHIDYLLHNSGKRVMRLDPGLAPFTNPGQPPARRDILILGRGEDGHLKGFDIAARALSEIHERVNLVIRGVTPGKGGDLKKELEQKINNPNVTVQPKEYTSKREKIEADLGRASLLLMPSRKEGFGLVGLEALAAGIPILISDQSGLAELLSEVTPNHKAVVAITDNEEKDAATWARRIDNELFDMEAAFARAQKHYQQLKDTLTWSKAAKHLIKQLHKVHEANQKETGKHQ